MDPTSELYQRDVDRVIRVMDDYLRAQILHSLGQREISDQDLRELSTYWVASAVSVRKLGKFVPDDVATTSPEKIQRYFLAEDCTWNRGLESYTLMAGPSLVDIIDDPIKRN